MEKIILNANVRTGSGKEANKKVRNAGEIPAVVYKKGKESLMLSVGAKEFGGVLHTSAGSNVIVTLKVKGDSKAAKQDDKTVMIKEMQYHPVKGGIIHVDFYEISLTEKITVDVAIELKGEAVGVKADGGVLDQPLKSLRIECLPTAIPGKIEYQIESLKIGDSVRVKDLQIPSDVKVLNDMDLTVVTISAPKIEAPAAEAVPGAEVTEPELIREKKPEAEEGEAEEKKEEKEAKPAKGKE